MAYNKEYKGTVEVNVQEAVDSLNNYEKKQFFIDNVDSVLDLKEVLECYNESELFEYIRNNYSVSDIFED